MVIPWAACGVEPCVAQTSLKVPQARLTSSKPPACRSEAANSHEGSFTVHSWSKQHGGGWIQDGAARYSNLGVGRNIAIFLVSPLDPQVPQAPLQCARQAWTLNKPSFLKFFNKGRDAGMGDESYGDALVDRLGVIDRRDTEKAVQVTMEAHIQGPTLIITGVQGIECHAKLDHSQATQCQIET